MPFTVMRNDITDMDIVNFGSLNIDYVYSVEHIAAPGETISSKSLEVFAGGKGLNQSIALARAGASVYHAGMVGDDGSMLVDLLAENNVDVRFVSRTKSRTGNAIIQLAENGENSIVLYGGANMAFTEEYVDETLDFFNRDTMVLLQNETNISKYVIDRAYGRGMKIALNPSPFDDSMKENDLSKVSVFIMNEIEGRQITGKDSGEGILAAMSESYPDAVIVMTLGESGAVLRSKDGELACAAYDVPVVDSTGAGDTFTGYFLAAFLAGESYEKALDMASKAAAISITEKGAANSIPLRRRVIAEELKRRC
jgi:ribokinase